MSLFDAFDEADKPVPLKVSKQMADDVPQVLEEAPANGMLTLRNVAHRYTLVDSKAKRADLISKLFMQKSVCFDTETTGVDVFSAELVGLSFCYKAGEAYYVSLPGDKNEALELLHEFKAFSKANISKKLVRISNLTCLCCRCMASN